jgi:hypothetical protein
MSIQKSIERIIAPPAPHMVGDGFRVHNFFPGEMEGNLARLSPFFLLDYNALMEWPPREQPRGVGVHPHRGFETVTFAYHGKIAHHDSAGNSGVIGEGDVQWMTAGSGVLHKEYHEKGFSRKGGPYQMVQLWVNLPAKYKMTDPKYQTILARDWGVYEIPDAGAKVRVLAGSYKDVKGPASTFTPMEIYEVSLQKGSAISFDLPRSYNTGLLMIKGKALVNTHEILTDHFAVFKNDGENISIEADADAIMLVLSGEPIHEPIFAYGPFVMNTREEIIKAYDDFNNGLFGYLED